MVRWILVGRYERVALIRNGRFVRLLVPGRYLVWTGWSLVDLERYDIREILSVEPVEALPRSHPGTRVLQVAEGQRALVRKDGVPFAQLRPGTYRIWEALGEVEAQVFDVTDEPVALARSDRIAKIMAGVTEAASDAERALVLQRDGLPWRVLPPGRYRIFAEGPYGFQTVPLTVQQAELAVQDLVTRDQVAVRIKPAVTYRVSDALRYVWQATSLVQLYGAAQLALREAVASRTLDELVTAREALSQELRARTVEALPDVGIAVETAYVKDIILSAEVKDLLGRVTLARKEAEALEIRRRQEVATTRQLANTAKLLEQSPVLLRLKELEAMADLAGRVDKLVVVGGSELTSRIGLRDLEGVAR